MRFPQNREKCEISENSLLLAGFSTFWHLFTLQFQWFAGQFPVTGRNREFWAQEQGKSSAGTDNFLYEGGTPGAITSASHRGAGGLRIANPPDGSLFCDFGSQQQKGAGHLLCWQTAETQIYCKFIIGLSVNSSTAGILTGGILAVFSLTGRTCAGLRLECIDHVVIAAIHMPQRAPFSSG
jgi:hypothetical protein